MINFQTVIIAHLYPLDRLALSQLISQQHSNIKITEVINWSELQNQLHNNQNFDLLLLDLALLESNSLQPLTDLRTNYPTLKTVTISHHRQTINNQLLREKGVTGNISSKDCRRTVIHALQKVAQGKCWFPACDTRTGAGDSANNQVTCKLSRQERRVMDKLVKGLMNKQIAIELKMSPNTAKVHVSSILRKLRVNNRTQAVLAHSKQMINSNNKLHSNYVPSKS